MDAPESTRVLTVEEQLAVLSQQISYHRAKAAKLRKRAEAQDRIADGKVKIAAELGTGTLPLVEASRGDGDSSCYGVSDV